MKTSKECIPCFLRQAQYTAALATRSEELQNLIIEKTTDLIKSFKFDISPPENAVSLYRMIGDLAGNSDTFSALKKASNRAALYMAGNLADIINKSETPLETAARLAIAGNIIDYGSHQEFDVEKTIQTALTDDLAINNLESFTEDLEQAKNILYLGDNCGELVFDRLFIETLRKPVTLAVKENPIINDALMSDAIECGLERRCRIISNGTDCPGTPPLKKCSSEFTKAWHKSDMIISKGQGNFETLSETRGPIYFMLMVKCPVVAGHINTSASLKAGSDIKTGDMIIMKHWLHS
jgi:hypothetical protein